MQVSGITPVQSGETTHIVENEEKSLITKVKDFARSVFNKIGDFFQGVGERISASVSHSYHRLADGVKDLFTVKERKGGTYRENGEEEQIYSILDLIGPRQQ